MFKCILRSLAWRILEKEINESYIHKGALYEYTKWMSRDFPIMEDTHDFFKDNPLGYSKDICRHRQAMETKHNIQHK